MLENQSTVPYRRVILDTNGWITKLRYLLPYLTEDVDEAFRGMMYAIVESVRYRDKAMRDIVAMVAALEQNIEYGCSVKQELVTTVKELAKEIYFRVEEYNLYNEDGLLMYTYFWHPDTSFEDVMLISVIQLTYNPTVPCYEPRVY